MRFFHFIFNLPAAAGFLVGFISGQPPEDHQPGNKKNGNNLTKKYYIITEKANKFKYKGKMADYEKLINKEKQEESEKNVKQISYADFLVPLPKINLQIPKRPENLDEIYQYQKDYGLGASVDRLVAALKW